MARGIATCKWVIAVVAIALLTCALFAIRPHAHAVDVPDEVMRGIVEVHMVDGDWKAEIPQGDTSFSGKSYTYYNASVAKVVVGGRVYQPGQAIATVTSGASGVCSMSGLPYGTYKVVQAEAPVGYSTNTEWSRTVSVRGEGEVVVIKDADSVPDAVWRGSVTFAKIDGATGNAGATGNLGLAGCEFTVYNMSKHPVHVHGVTYGLGDAVGTCVTGSDGFASFDDLPYGTYYARETKAPSGYRLNSSWSQTFSIRENNEMVDCTHNPCGDDAFTGSVRVSKVDAETGAAQAQGDATLAGAVFEFTNVSDRAVYVGGQRIRPGFTAATAVTGSDGVAYVPSLPHGTYSVREVSAPYRGYHVDDAWTMTFDIESDGQVVDLTESPAHDAVVRGGFSLEKQDGDWHLSQQGGNATLSGAVFRVYNVSAGPVLVDGTLHATARTSLGGWSLAGAEPVATLVTDADGKCSLPTNALPYGTYVVREELAPAGYRVNADLAHGVEFEVREEGQMAYADVPAW